MVAGQYTPYHHPTGVPYSQEAEEAVLGAVLVNPDVFLIVAAFLKPGDFYILRHAYIWEALLRISERDEAIDYVTLGEELRALGRLSDIGGPAYLTQVVNAAASSQHAEVYGRLVERAAIRRRLLVAADEIKALALDEELDIELVQAQSQERLDQTREGAQRANHLPGALSVASYALLLDDLHAKRQAGDLIGYTLPPTWSTLRDAVPTVLPGWLVVITGDSGSGKSALMEAWAEHLAGEHIPSAYIHTEMSTEDMLHRRMARYSGFAFHALATGQVESAQTLHADERIQTFARWLSYHWMPDVAFAALATKMRRLADGGVKVFFIDHFQDIQPPGGGKNENIVRAFEQMCVWFNAFAENRKVLVVVGSQQTKQGDTKWAKKLNEKAVLRLSIRRPPLKTEYTYVYRNIEYRYPVGAADPRAQIVIRKARFGISGACPMFYHGAGIAWLDAAAVQRPAAAGKIIPLEAGQPKLINE